MAPRIFLYRVQTDAGCAPNIDGDICTLAICKPQIRRSAVVGDIVIGLRARSGEIGALGPNAIDSVLYVMQVTRKMTLQEYDTYCTEHLPVKIPSDINDFRGDCQYTVDGKQRELGPHGPMHAKKDLSGRYVLLADAGNYWYRRDPIGVRLTEELATSWDVAGVARGHRVKVYKNSEVMSLFDWLATFPTIDSLRSIARLPKAMCSKRSYPSNP